MKNPKTEISGTLTHRGFTCRMTKEVRSPKSDPGLRASRSVLDCASPLALSWRAGGSSAIQSGRGLPNSKTWRLWLAVLISVFSFQLSAFSQSYSIPWHTMDCGGGTSTNGHYSVTGTIGQPDAGGPMTNGQYSVTGGFWALPQAVQTEGAPTLTIAKGAPGFANISWTPATATNWVLQERFSLTVGAWTNSPSGSTNPITVPATLPIKFYRLFKP